MTKVDEILVLAKAMRTVLNGIDPKLKEKYGQKMMDEIADYPLYATTSNITYDEALAIGAILLAYDEMEMDDEKV